MNGVTSESSKLYLHPGIYVKLLFYFHTDLDCDSQSLYTAAILEDGGPNEHPRGEDCYGISLILTH